MASLSEITSIKGDASLAGGGGVVDGYQADNRIALSYLNDYATAQAGVNQYLLKQHDTNLQNYLTRMGGDDLAVKGVLSGDRQALMNDYVSYAKTVADNYGAIRNPLSNREASANLMATEAGFRNKLSQSQQDNAYVTEQQKFLDQHPDFKTPENLEKIQKFISSPVGQREYFRISPPMIADFDAIAKVAESVSKQAYATAKTDGRYVSKEEGEKINRDSFLNFFKSENLGRDKWGQSVLVSAKKQYDELVSRSLDSAYQNFDDFLLKQGEMRIPQNQIKKADLDEDQFATIAASGAEARKTAAMNNAFEAGENAKDRAIKWAELDLKKEKVNPDEAGLLKNELLYRAFTKDTSLDEGKGYSGSYENLGQNVPNGVLQNIYGDNNKISIKDELGGTVTMPRISVIGNYVTDDGYLVVHLRDNKTGKQVNKKKISFDKAYNDFNFIKGSDNASKLADGSAKWVKNKTGAVKPTYELLKKALDPDSYKQSEGGGSYRKSINQSEISGKAAAAGYTVAEYTELLKQKGIKIE